MDIKEYLSLYFWDIISKHYFDFKGRVGRKTFWLFSLNIFLINFILGMLSLGVISMILSLIILLPSLGISIRRLHDINASGWWILLALIPVLGGLILIVLACIKGTQGENKYGVEEGSVVEISSIETLNK